MERTLLPLDVRGFISSERLYKYVCDLASFGPKSPGMPGDEKSVKYITDLLNEWGLEVKLESCDIYNFIQEESKVEMVSPVKKTFESICHYRSGSVDSVTAEVKYVGFGEEKDYENIDVKGCIVLADLGKIHPVPKANLAYKNGAVACLWPHSAPGGRIAAWGLGKEGAPLPVMGISYESGQFLKEKMQEGPVLLNVKAKCKLLPGKQDHIIAEIKGREKPDETIILIAHRETTHVTPGANDNGSGVAVLLELARLFSMLRPKRSLRFIFSAAEEGGGLGIRQYVEKYIDDIKKSVKAVINLDMVGVGEKLCIVRAGHFPGYKVETSEFLNKMLLKVAKSMNYSLNEWECPFGLADIGPFIDAGIPSTWLYQTGDVTYHTKDDVPEHIDPNDLKAACDITGKTVLELMEK